MSACRQAGAGDDGFTETVKNAPTNSPSYLIYWVNYVFFVRGEVIFYNHVVIYVASSQSEDCLPGYPPHDWRARLKSGVAQWPGRRA